MPLNINKNKRLNIEPARLKKNVGPRKVPTMMLTINTRIIETHTAVDKIKFNDSKKNNDISNSWFDTRYRAWEKKFN